MNAAARLYADYQEKLKQLRESCQHTELSGWMLEEWAPAHYTAFQVRVCTNCEQVVSRKTTCFRCRKEIVDGDIYEGDGRIVPHARYCLPCFEQVRAERQQSPSI